MSEQNFDKLIKEKLAQNNFVPTKVGWDKIHSAISNNIKTATAITSIGEETVNTKPTKKRFFSIAKIAAIILPFFMACGVYLMLHKNKIDTNTAQINQTKKENLPTIEKQIQAENNNIKPVETNKKAFVANDNKLVNTIAPTNNQNNIEKQNTIILKNTIDKNANQTTQIANNNNNQNVINQNTIAENKIENKIVEISNTPNNIIEKKKIIDIEKNTNNEVVKNNIENKTTAQKQNTNFIPLEITTPNAKKAINKSTALNIISGAMVNAKTVFGNGYNFGVSGVKNVTNKIYIDASFIVSRNNPSWIQNQYNDAATNQNQTTAFAKNGYTIANSSTENAFGVNQATNKFVADGNSISLADLQDDAAVTNAIAYRLASTQLEAAPMIGLKIVSKLNVAAGADAIYLVKSNTYLDALNKLKLHSVETPIVNNWDMGFIGKLEYHINKKISVAYKHRQALTPFASNNNTNVYRNYHGVIVSMKVW